MGDERGKTIRLDTLRGCVADTSFDVLIIGSGPGGYVTAFRVGAKLRRAGGIRLSDPTCVAPAPVELLRR